ncbi:MAG: peptide chain release factor N(5)-glutamine methyltransferase [Bowdeniella nasicola]|nr:peptide chain release factor N(5)-glutamine methyltransferase [Bowdeniella nasicola]
MKRTDSLRASSGPNTPRTGRQLEAELGRRLAAAGLNSPRAEARQIARHVLGDEPLLVQELSPRDIAAGRELVAARLTGRPLQHILGEMAFRSLTLVSDERALIVRPETELVAGVAIDAALRAGSAPRVLDLGTGSGAIALAIATEVPGAVVIGVDLSAEALSLAHVNAERCRADFAPGARVAFVHADLRSYTPEPVVDVLVSNPPYLPADERVPAEVAHDPDLALRGGGADGLDLPFAVLSAGWRALAPGGVLVLEHHDAQGRALRAAASAQGYEQAHTGRDLTGRDRYLWARRPTECQMGPKRGRIPA